MKTVFGGVYAPSTVGTLLREFTFGHARQLESVLGEHLVALCERVDLLPAAEQVFIDIDSLLRPVYGHAKQGASYETKIAGIPRKGVAGHHDQHPRTAPVISGMRLRAGRANSGKGAGRMVASAISTVRAIVWDTTILVRGDSAYGNRTVVRTCVRHGAQFSLVMTQQRDRTRHRRDRRACLDPWCPIPVRSKTPTPERGSLMPRSPKSLTPPSRPPPMRSPPGWWCAASRTPATATPCSRSGGITGCTSGLRQAK